MGIPEARTNSEDPKNGYSMTVAPLVANGVVIAGVSGAEYGVRAISRARCALTEEEIEMIWAHIRATVDH